jgi:RNA polymerase sigma-70 factor (ECF subfamily)
VTDRAPAETASLPGFDEFFDATYGRILAYARFLARNMVDAEQAAADAYAATAKQWGRVGGFEAREAYVRRIVWQKLGKEHRRQRRRWGAETRRGPVSPRPTDPELSAEVRMVLDLIPKLPPKQRAVLILCCQEYTSEEIAQELGMKPSTVRTHLARARRRLRDALGITPGRGTDRTDKFVPAASAGRGNASSLPGPQQLEYDQLTALLHRSEAELREALVADQARMERIRDLVAAQVAGRRGWRGR